MNKKPTVVIFFNDWKVYPHGVNAGGGESATMALAREIYKKGHRVIACANLPEGETSKDGIEFWNFGQDYSLHLIEKRLRDIGLYYCLCATLVSPLMLLREHENCLARILINHAPSAHASGLEPTTVMELIDYMACVSHAQRSMILGRGSDPDKIVVIRNGFDPEIFPYAGPESRDWNELVFIGRVEPAKGIHILVQVFGQLKAEYPELKLSVYGDTSFWPDFVKQIPSLESTMPGLKFKGKVPQRELAANLRKAGLLVFPSISFESAGLAVVDAQASGCPVVAFGVGGVPEYLDSNLGDVIYERTPEALIAGIRKLLRDRPRMVSISEKAAQLGRSRPWAKVAEEMISLADKVAQKKTSSNKQKGMPTSIGRMKNFAEVDPRLLLEDHDRVAQSYDYTETELEIIINEGVTEAWPHLVKGLRLEKHGSYEEAIQAYKEAATRSKSEDWQAFFRLALIHADRKEISLAATYAKSVLERAPTFPLRSQLQKLISLES
jgi:glycosyltransferase involved in cell wall biosynthesis